MQAMSVTRPSGELNLRVIRGGLDTPAARKRLRDYVPDFMPRLGLGAEVNEYRTKNLPNVWRGARTLGLASVLGIPTFYGELYLKVLRGSGETVDLGLVSLRVVTSAGVNYLAADVAGGANDSNLFKFHGFGTGTGAEASGDTALGTEFTTEYATDSTRPTGSQASATNTYTTIATFSPDSGGTLAVTEHGIFSASSAGTLWDRSKFSAVNLVSGSDSLQATYVATFAAGG
jgi:hypothetical protein